MFGMITTIKARAHTQAHANTSQKNTRPPRPECGGSGQSRCGQTCFPAAPLEASCFQVCMSASTASITLAVTMRCRHCPLSGWGFVDDFLFLHDVSFCWQLVIRIVTVFPEATLAPHLSKLMCPKLFKLDLLNKNVL